MRIESSVTSLSWIPSEAVRGATRFPFEMGVAHYDEVPPDRIDDLDALLRAGRFRFANVLRAWIDVEHGRITAHGYSGRSLINDTRLGLGGRVMASFAPMALPDLRRDPEVGDGWVRFVQTCGGGSGVPAPRRVSHPPFVQVSAPMAWTTLTLTIHADGRSEHALSGASPFPRHWVYGEDGALAQKSGLVDFKEWYLNAFGTHTPWGDEDSPALVSEVESALERELSARIMRGNARPRVQTLRAGDALITEGEEGREVHVVLDGLVEVEVAGRALGQLGPGAVLGERALIEGGRRTATVRASTRCRVATVAGDELDPAVLAELAASHRREDAPA